MRYSPRNPKRVRTSIAAHETIVPASKATAGPSAASWMAATTRMPITSMTITGMSAYMQIACGVDTTEASAKAQ
jgi:hypothetical protein